MIQDYLTQNKQEFFKHSQEALRKELNSILHRLSKLIDVHFDKVIDSETYHLKAVFNPMCNVSSTIESPDVGFEPTTNGLTVHCSTAELIRNKSHYHRSDSEYL